MKKEIYVIAGRDAETYRTFRDRMVATAAEAVHHYNPVRASVTLTEGPPPALSVIPFRKSRVAVFTLVRREDDMQPVNLLTAMDGFRFACVAEEALPVSYTKDWPDGSVTPGVCLLTIFRSRPDIPYETFIDRWHNSHTPLSLKIHPLWHYNRNVVKDTIAGTEKWGGIVEEHMRKRSQLTNPFAFFGHPGVIIQRMIAVYRDTKSFIDYNTIETYLCREYRVKG